jgi:hypothetical protein
MAFAEGVGRIGLGLGDPPLSIADPEIEYLFKPGAYRRFGNTVRINSRHMRSEEISPHKSTPDEVRVMVLGDSVVNGGGLTDQTELATEIAKADLSARLQRPVAIGNISAGSWGPENLLGYVRKFGLCDADVVILVLNSMDIGDTPSPQSPVGVDPGFPDERPPFALYEAVARYVMPKVRALMGEQESNSGGQLTEEALAAARKRSTDALVALHAAIEATGAKQVWLHFPMHSEIEGSLLPGADGIETVARECNVPLVSLREQYREALRTGQQPYRPADSIHPNATGQRILAEQIVEIVEAEWDQARRP